MCALERRRSYLEVGFFVLLVVLDGVCAAGRQHRYLEAAVFSFSGEPV